MTSKKQIRANRRNAKKSTGPKTKAGKERSARNAIKHGLFTDILLLPHEDGAALAMLKNNLHADFRPVTHMQAIVIDRLAMLIWRERRPSGSFRNSRLAARRPLPSVRFATACRERHAHHSSCQCWYVRPCTDVADWTIPDLALHSERANSEAIF